MPSGWATQAIGLPFMVSPASTVLRGALATVCAELALPEIVTENQDGIASRYLRLFGPKGTSQLRLDSHYRKEVAADEHAHPESGQRVGL